MGCPCPNVTEDGDWCEDCPAGKEIVPAREKLNEECLSAWHIFRLLAGPAVERFHMQELIWQLLDIEMTGGEAFLFVERLNLIEQCINELAREGVGTGRSKTSSKNNSSDLSAYKKNLQTMRSER